jgi:hypothetical protein
MHSSICSSGQNGSLGSLEEKNYTGGCNRDRAVLPDWRKAQEDLTNRSDFAQPAPLIRFRIQKTSSSHHVRNGEEHLWTVVWPVIWAASAPLVGKLLVEEAEELFNDAFLF